MTKGFFCRVIAVVLAASLVLGPWTGCGPDQATPRLGDVELMAYRMGGEISAVILCEGPRCVEMAFTENAILADDLFEGVRDGSTIETSLSTPGLRVQHNYELSDSGRSVVMTETSFVASTPTELELGVLHPLAPVVERGRAIPCDGLCDRVAQMLRHGLDRGGAR